MVKAKKQETKKQETKSVQPIIQHDAFISKNKKRKEKRQLQSAVAKQAETGDFIPVKKNSLKPLPLTGLSKKGKAQLSTSLPIKGNAKGKFNNPNRSFANSASANDKLKKVTGILSNPNTPKRNRSKNEHVTFELSKNTKNILDDETKVDQKPINEKAKKPPQKGPKKQLPVESSDEYESDDDVTGEDFLDMEASEGEETDSLDNGANSDASSDDEDDDDDVENKYLSNFMNDGESDSEDEDDDEDDDDDEDEDEDEDSEDDDGENTPLKVEAPKSKAGKQKNGPANAAAAKGKAVEVAVSATPTKKGKVVELKKETKPSSFTPTKEEKVTAPKPEPKKTKKEQTKSEDAPVNEKVEKNKKAKSVETETSKNEKSDKPSDFIGFIRKIPSTVTQKDIKSAVSKIVAANDVVEVVMVKGRKSSEQKAFVYVKDAKSLGDLIHKKIEVGDSTFIVYRAKVSAEEESAPKPVAFLPRVPMWVTETEMRQGIEKEIGAGKVKEVTEKKINKIQQTKNILVLFDNVDDLKKAIQLGDFTVKDHTVIIREAAEGIKVPVFRAVLANIPEKTNEAVVKKTLEASIGKNTVVNVRFSFRKKSFAFVVFNDETAMEKALALGDSLSVKGAKVEVRAYLPHQPRKRAPPSEQAKAKAAQKRKQKSTSKSDGQQEQASPKKLKTDASTASNASTSPSPSGPRSQKKKNRRKKSVIASPSGQVKATKNTKPANKPKFSKAAPAAPSPAKTSKVTPLKDKIQSKKEQLKGEMSKKRKVGKK